MSLEVSLSFCSTRLFAWASQKRGGVTGAVTKGYATVTHPTLAGRPDRPLPGPIVVFPARSPAMVHAPLRVDRIRVKSRSGPYRLSLFAQLALLSAHPPSPSSPLAAEFIPTCGPQFAGMLACWASSGDLRNGSTCVEASNLLKMCLKSAVSFSLTLRARLEHGVGAHPSSLLRKSWVSWAAHR